jgi:DNA helicase IV
MAAHPELAAEQAYIDHAYACLEDARRKAVQLRRMTAAGRGGTHQNRYESERIEDAIRERLASLDVGDAALVFGRLDREGGDVFYVGRVAVADEGQEPVVVDWRAPVSEPFYRATGRNPMGLARRRHFAVRGRRLLDLEDEVFGGDAGEHDELVGRQALIAALEQSRTGRLGDIVATIQAEQDEIIRDELGGVVVVQGGPGTGKTVVALHRAAYLLYTHRFPLEGQGVLVVGPNRLFLGYIDRVLPSLGEAGVELATLADLIPEATGTDPGPRRAAAVKGDVRMARVLAKAVHDRQRPLREDLVVGWGVTNLRLTVAASERVVRAARRRARQHNPGRRAVEQLLWEELSRSWRGRGAPPEPPALCEQLRRDPDVRAALERMWPVLTPADLLRDLFGSRALTALAAGRLLDADEQAALHRDRGPSTEGYAWTAADVALLDEARALLGRRQRSEEEDVRTYGHIVVDEAQDLSPMQLRMLARRSLGGSMTVVGDLAQATGAWAPAGWDEVLAHLPSRKPPRVRQLTIGYRTPGQIMELANRVLAVAAPHLEPPRAVRPGDRAPVIERAEPGGLGRRLVARVAEERAAVGDGNVAVVAPDSLVDELADALDAAGVAHSRAGRRGLDAQVNLVPVRLVKGLELDSVIVVEPGRIVSEEPQGLRSLYVALTRATQRLAVVHAEPLPDVLR